MNSETKVYKPQAERYKEIEKQWLRFINNQKVNKNILSPYVYESWRRSKSLGIDPYSIDDKKSTGKDLTQRIKAAEELIEAAWPYIEMVEDIVSGTGLRFDLFDGEGYSLKIIGDKEVIEQAEIMGFTVGSNRSEEVAGTSAVALAILENRPIQIFGAEHFNELHHDMNCSAAPVHNSKGEIVGVVNISSYATKQSRETLGLVTSIGKTIENRLALNKTLEDLIVYNDTLSKIMEYLPQGIAYIGDGGILERYNQKLLTFFDLADNRNNKTVKNQILKILYQIDCWQTDKELEHEEVLIKFKNKVKSFLLSTRKIKKQKGTLLIIEDTDSILKLNTSLRGNKAIYHFDDIIGEDKKIKEAITLGKKVASSSSAVLIYGESGTGKEIMAQAIHNGSFRRDKPFIAINCGAIPSELIESELFGYEAGAFTGALKGGKPGKLEIASNGTLFLDEVESMPLNVQIKLLRALSSNRITRLGGVDEIKTNFRLIAATKKDLLKEADEGNFREDLYYRINIVTIQLPSLRKRKGDIPILTKYFLETLGKQFCLGKIKASDEFYQALYAYNWRGNVRELKNVIERTLLLIEDAEEIGLDHLPEKVIKAYQYNTLKKEMESRLARHSSINTGLLRTGEEIIIEMVIREEEGNLSRAAKRLGIARSTLYQKLHESEKLVNVLNSYNR